MQVTALLFVVIVFTIIDFHSSVKLNVGSPSVSRISQVKIDDALINVEVADTPETRGQGLGGRESLASDSGMLFVFPTPDKYSFWMKGMKIPLDFIWIKGTSVIDLLPDIQPPDPGTPDTSLPVYQPVEPVDHVLELSAGFISANNIKIGDSVKYISK